MTPDLWTTAAIAGTIIFAAAIAVTLIAYLCRPTITEDDDEYDPERGSAYTDIWGDME
jgi:hypothetical protein